MGWLVEILTEKLEAVATAASSMRRRSLFMTFLL